MDDATVHGLRKAVESAKRAAQRAKLDNCDVDDINEAIQVVEQELEKPTPNKNKLTMYLNSIARSFMALPMARSASGKIDKALRAAGLPATWEQ